MEKATQPRSVNAEGQPKNSFYSHFSKRLEETFHREVKNSWDDLQFEMISYLVAALKLKATSHKRKPRYYLSQKKRLGGLELFSVLRSAPKRIVPEPPFTEDHCYYTFLDLFIDWIASFVEAAMNTSIRQCKKEFLAQNWNPDLIQAFLQSQYDHLIAHAKSQETQDLYKKFRLVLAGEIAAINRLEEV